MKIFSASIRDLKEVYDTVTNMCPQEYRYKGRDVHQAEIKAGCVACEESDRKMITTQSIVPSELWPRIPHTMDGAKRCVPICKHCQPKYQRGAYALRRRQDELFDAKELLQQWVDYMKEFALFERLPSRWLATFED